jgi:endoglucanase
VGQIRTLVDDGLPPDWAVLRQGEAVASAPPNGGQVGFGFDAMRVPIRLAEDCDPAVRKVAASLWPQLRRRDRGNPVEYVAAAAAADAAGQRRERDLLLGAAEQLGEAQPTYYGAAWIALGRVMLTTDLLGRCP